ncbi:amidohydrolase family protein [Kangiella sp.]|uniref:amidohydrolase family protein n=1 Tax=Kangiella sp. TaxID=1920245 RepID=UPI0019CAA4D0|nr:amidohydrolase family protein [Kangiella sp.]MBD3653822.1 amidohydrolase family protein [Kangiella sp.]
MSLLSTKSLAKSVAAALGVASLIAGICSAETTLIKDAKIHTLSSQGVLQSGDVLFEDGVIKAVGEDLSVEADTVIDGAGKVVTPGIFAQITQIGLVELGSQEQTADARTEHEEQGASFSVDKVYNHNSTLVAVNRSNGVTRTLVAPQVGSTVFAGQGAIMSLKDQYHPLIAKDVAIFTAFGEWSAEGMGGSRASVLFELNKAFDEARLYQKNRTAIEQGDFRELTYSIADLEALQAVINREIPLLVNTQRESDILTMLDFAKEQNIRIGFVGAAEAWKVADQLAEADASVFVDPMDNLPDSFESLGKRYENAAILSEAGVKVMFLGQGFLATHNAYTVRHSAGNAVAYGMDYDKALAAMMSTPAGYFGGDETYGQIAEGYKAELVLWNGDPLEVTTLPEQVWIDGEAVSMENRSTKLRDRYKDLDTDKNTGYRK